MKTYQVVIFLHKDAFSALDDSAKSKNVIGQFLQSLTLQVGVFDSGFWGIGFLESGFWESGLLSSGFWERHWLAFGYNYQLSYQWQNLPER